MLTIIINTIITKTYRETTSLGRSYRLIMQSNLPEVGTLKTEQRCLLTGGVRLYIGGCKT